MLVCLSGRLGSGKTLLSSKLLSLGFRRTSFAEYLKILVADTYECDVALLKDENAKKEILSVPWQWNDVVAKRLFDLASINYAFDITPRVFSTRREALQYIGTDVLKKHNPNFHAEKMMSNLDDGDYVCDDLRFMDELMFIKDAATKCYHIIRPNNFLVSNHSSERSLNWSHFENIIINDRAAETVQNEFLDDLYVDNKIDYCIGKYLPFLHATRNASYYGAILSQLATRKVKKTNPNKAFISIDRIDVGKVIWLAKRINDSFSTEIVDSAGNITCPYIMENLKLWIPEPSGLPSFIESDSIQRKYWDEGILEAKSLLL